MFGARVRPEWVALFVPALVLAALSAGGGQQAFVQSSVPADLPSSAGLAEGLLGSAELLAAPLPTSQLEPSQDPYPDPDPEEAASERSAETVTIVFGGDIHFEGQIREALAADPDTALAPLAAMMADADLAIANLETAVTERGTPAAKEYNFRTTPDAFVALRAAGIDVVSMANNHGMDYGSVGLQDSLAAAEAADFDVIGIGLDAEEAYAPWSQVVRGQRIAVLAATQVLDSALISAWTATDSQLGLASAKEVDRLVAAVELARLGHDTVIVFLHWGVEGETCPTTSQIDLADRLVAAGADIVVGGHAHRIQGGGFKNSGGSDNSAGSDDRAYVHYGLGNFAFYTSDGPGTESGVLRLRVNGRAIEGVQWIPARIVNGVATALGSEEAQAAVAAWDGLRSCTDLAA